MQGSNKIIQRVELPKEFIEIYIKFLLLSQKNENNKNLKSKFTRIISVFISNLICHGHIKFDKVPDEVFLI
jgi:hypothetical protein